MGTRGSGGGKYPNRMNNEWSVVVVHAVVLFGREGAGGVLLCLVASGVCAV